VQPAATLRVAFDEVQRVLFEAGVCSANLASTGIGVADDCSSPAGAEPETVEIDASPSGRKVYPGSEPPRASVAAAVQTYSRRRSPQHPARLRPGTWPSS